MPYSDGSLRPWVAAQLAEAGVTPASVVDVGAGAGEGWDFYAPLWPGAAWTAIEVYAPYVPAFGLERKYGRVLVGDVRLMPLPAADLYLFGDVLEHMPAADAVALWDRARRVAAHLVIGIPVEPYPQGPVYGNPHEAHLHDWDVVSVLASFAGITSFAGPLPGSRTAAFIAAGLGQGLAEGDRLDVADLGGGVRPQGDARLGQAQAE